MQDRSTSEAAISNTEAGIPLQAEVSGAAGCKRWAGGMEIGRDGGKIRRRYEGLARGLETEWEGVQSEYQSQATCLLHLG